MILTVTEEQRTACGHAVELLMTQADGLRRTGSQGTVGAIEQYVATLRKVAGQPGKVDLNEAEKVHLEQATFLLEGIRDGLLTADFRDRATVIQGDIKKLNELIAAYNAAA
jgi:hypothetical protein